MKVWLACMLAVFLLSKVESNALISPHPKPLLKAPKDSITTGHHIVVLKHDSSNEELHAVMEKVKRMSDEVTVHRYTEHVGNTFTVNAPSHVVDKIRNLKEVNHVEEDDLVFGESVTDYTEQPNATTVYKKIDYQLQKQTWFLDRLNQPRLPLDNILPRTSDIQGVVDVYVLDSGILYNHSEFDNRAKYAGYDPVDEAHVTAETKDYKMRFGRDCNGHGTLVASLIGGKTFGTAKNVNLLSVRVLNCQLAGTTSVILDGLNFIAAEVAHRKRPTIVSMALRGTIHNSLTNAINTLNTKNVLIVGSAGNTQSNACNYFPANNDKVLRVGASTETDNIYEKSNYGECVDVFAPGSGIQGPEINCPTCHTSSKHLHDGTSLATAIVSGVAAVHLSHSPLFEPYFLKNKIIEESVKDVLKLNLTSVPHTPNRLVNIGCEGSYMLDSQQSVLIQSPLFPENYPNSVKCTWTIYTPEDTNAMVHFEFVTIERNYDTLKICSGTSCDDKNYLLAELTGDYGEVSCGYTSFNSALTIELHTDETTTSTGFRANCTAVKSNTMNECVEPVKATSLQLDVLSQGSNVGNRFSMSIDWQEVFGGRRRGLNVATIDEVTGELISTENYDTYSSSTNSLNFSRKIEQLHPGALVMVASSSNAVNGLSDRAKRALRTIGSEYNYQLSSTSSWAMISVKGLRYQYAVESFNNSLAVSTSAQFQLQAHKQYGIRITVLSSGNYNGAELSITVDGKEIKIADEDGSTTGLNVVVIDQATGAVLDARVFNTYAEVVSDYTPSDPFVDYINSLPNGQVVAIGIKGDAITQLTQEAKAACKSIGSQLIDNAQIDRSWAIVGRKGTNKPGEVSETVKYNSKARATYYLRVGDQRNDAFCNISASSSTKWTSCNYGGRNGSFIAIGDTAYPSDLCPSSYGITVGVVKNDSCEFEMTAQYNTHSSSYYNYNSNSNKFASFIDNIPTGRIVVISFSYDAVNSLYSNGKQALEKIGSAHRYSLSTYNAYAIIGRKGAPPGSVPEAYQDVDQPYTASVSASVPLEAPELPDKSECSASIYKVNCRAGHTKYYKHGGAN